MIKTKELLLQKGMFASIDECKLLIYRYTKQQQNANY